MAAAFEGVLTWHLAEAGVGWPPCPHVSGHLAALLGQSGSSSRVFQETGSAGHQAHDTWAHGILFLYFDQSSHPNQRAGGREPKNLLFTFRPPCGPSLVPVILHSDSFTKAQGQDCVHSHSDFAGLGYGLGMCIFKVPSNNFKAWPRLRITVMIEQK